MDCTAEIFPLPQKLLIFFYYADQYLSIISYLLYLTVP